MRRTAMADWRRTAACRDLAVDRFFPEPHDHDGVRAARAVCRSCPVREECLDYALDHGRSLLGIFGGTTEKERRPMRRERQVAS